MGWRPSKWQAADTTKSDGLSALLLPMSRCQWHCKYLIRGHTIKYPSFSKPQVFCLDFPTALKFAVISASPGQSHRQTNCTAIWYAAVRLFTWWRHQMETCSALLDRSLVDSPHKGQWRGALMFFWSAPEKNGWANHRDAGDLRHHRAHHDWCIEVILSLVGWFTKNTAVRLFKWIKRNGWSD